MPKHISEPDMTDSVSRALALCAVIAAALPAATLHAEEAEDGIEWHPYVIVSGDVDDADSSQALLEVGTSIGATGWIRAGVGRAELAETDIETDVLQLGGGLSIKAIDASAGIAHRSDGDGFEQRDWNFSLGWQGARGAIGVDVFVRDAESETVTSVTRRRLNPRSVRITESIDGTGYGVHADFDFTPALTAFGAWMTYDYDIATNHPILLRLSVLNGSGITRSEAFLDQSYSAGLTYHFSYAALTARYLHDEALVEDDITDAFELSLQILLGEHWSVTPMAGIADNDLLGDSVFGGLSIGYTW